MTGRSLTGRVRGTWPRGTDICRWVTLLTKSGVEGDSENPFDVNDPARGSVRRVEIDTPYFSGNSAGWVSLHGIDATSADLDDAQAWSALVPRTGMQPDTRHFFGSKISAPVTHVRLDVFPDGGLARLRVNGEIDPETLHEWTGSGDRACPRCIGEPSRPRICEPRGGGLA